MRNKDSLKDFILPAFWLFCLLLITHSKQKVDNKEGNLNREEWLKEMSEKNIANNVLPV